VYLVVGVEDWLDKKSLPDPKEAFDDKDGLGLRKSTPCQN
jgi:hypothetical protein